MKELSALIQRAPLFSPVSFETPLRYVPLLSSTRTGPAAYFPQSPPNSSDQPFYRGSCDEILLDQRSRVGIDKGILPLNAS